MAKLFVLISLAGIIACSQSDPPTQPVSGSRQPHLATSSLSLDDRFLEVDRHAPGFGGMFLLNGDPYAYVTDLEQSQSTLSALRSVFPERTDLSVDQVHFVIGEFRFSELHEWRSGINGRLGDGEVLSTDVDESENRIVVGVETPAAVQNTRQFIEELRIPEEAVEVAVVERPVPLSTLRDAVRPVQGGVQIDGPSLCSLGFNAILDDEALLITNSHCSDEMASLDGSSFYQPFPSNHFIGTEVIDPAFSSITGCPSGKTCRWSDSAAIEVVDSIATALGEIAKTTQGTGSVTIVGTLYVVGESSPLFGATVGKIGRSTGWTSGTVTATCQDITFDPGKILLCQNSTSVSVAFGDSGSPLFVYIGGPGSNQIALSGIVWGGGSGSSKYSPLSGIRSDLGQLDVQYLGCPPPQVNC